MASKATVAAEKFHECEVKRRRVRSNGSPGYESFWKVKTVLDAVADGDTEFRCKDCHGALKLTKRNTVNGVIAHVEHKSKIDAEHCGGSATFLQATDGRIARISASPVQ